MSHLVHRSKQYSFELVRGVSLLRDGLAELMTAATQWGQLDEVAEIPFLLTLPVRPKREPLLVLVRQRSDADLNLMGAVLIFAHVPSVLGHRLLAHAGNSGERSVFGPATERTRLAMYAALFLMARGSASIALSYRGPVVSVDVASELQKAVSQQRAIVNLVALGNPIPCDWALVGALRRIELPLASRFDDTLLRVGRRTRRNMRAAMRLCEREQKVRLIFDPTVSMQEFRELNSTCARPSRQDVLRWRLGRYQALPGAFLAGLRSSDGRWMGLAGGRKTGGTVTLDWQMNSKAFARYSVSLALRGLLAEHFGAEGASALRFEGGTAHRLSKAFRRDMVYTLRLRRSSLWMSVLEGAMTRFMPARANTRSVFPIGLTAGGSQFTRQQRYAL